MDIFFSILESVGVLLGLGALGFYIIGKRIMPGNVLGFLSPLALDIALPCLIFVSIIQNFTLEKFPDWWKAPLWWIAFTIALLILTLITMFISNSATRREFAISLFYQNGIFFPLAIISGLYGSDSVHLVTLILFISFHPALLFSTYFFFFRSQPLNSIDWRKIIHPVLIMTLAALFLRLYDLHTFVPNFIISGLSMLAAMALPLIMIILGGNIFIDFKGKGDLQLLEAAKFVFVKNFFFPLVCLGVLLIIRPSYHIALILFLQSAVPPITAIPIFTKRLGGNSAIANQFLVSSCLFLLVSLPIMFTLFNKFFHV
jgi:predicted permease